MTVVRDYPHDLEHFVITKDNISRFVSMENARPLKPATLSSLKNLLKNGGHFASAFYVNRVRSDGKTAYHLVDGHHRREAIRWMIEHDPDYGIDVDFVSYANLTDAQEKDLFDRLNTTTKVNNPDKLFVHQNELPVVKRMITDDFPTPLDCGAGVPDRRKPYLKLYPFVKAHYGIKKNKDLRSYDTFNWEQAKEFDGDDYDRMSEFAKDFNGFASDMFGNKSVMKNNTITIIYRLWVTNCVKIPFIGGIPTKSREVFGERIKETILKWRDVSDLLRWANRTPLNNKLIEVAENTLLEKMNYNRHSPRLMPSNGNFTNEPGAGLQGGVAR
jgi:hypothetical protein